MSDIYTVVAETRIEELRAVRTEDCPILLTASVPELHRLPAEQPATQACVIQTLTFQDDWTFLEAAMVLLGIESETAAMQHAPQLLAERHALTLSQVQEIVLISMKNDGTGMRLDENGMFFPLLTGDPGEPVVMGLIMLIESWWVITIYSLNQVGDWTPNQRMVVRKSDPAVDFAA